MCNRCEQSPVAPSERAPWWAGVGWLASGDVPRERREAAAQAVFLAAVVVALVAVIISTATRR
jgi:hypothetical protein